MANEFKANVGGKVSKKEAMEWIEKYEKEMRKDKMKDTKSVFFGRDVLTQILSEEGCTGITFFFAMKYNESVKKDTLQLVLVPTRSDGTYIWPGEGSGSKLNDGGSAFDYGWPCPPYC